MSASMGPQMLPPPPASSHHGFGTVGPLIGVLAVILVLGVAAGMIGRLCTGRRTVGHREFDLEGWIERKCAPCIDGRVESPPSPPGTANGSATAESLEEGKQEER